MELHEALRASKSREAIGYSPNGSFVFPSLDGIAKEQVNDLPVVTADDSGVVYLLPNPLYIGVLPLRRSWVDLLPEEHAAVFGLEWEPIDPKDPLTLLAESVTDWVDDEQ